MGNAVSGADWLQQLLKLMGFNTSVQQISAAAFSSDLGSMAIASIDSDDSEGQNYWLEISAENLQQSQIANIIGQDGAVIDAIQYLANVILNHESATAESNPLPSHQPSHQPNHTNHHHFYTIELNNYRTAHLADLQALTEQAIQQVRQTGNEFVMKNLSAADRRYVHHLLDSCTDIENFSQGREPHRYLIVKLVATHGKDIHTADC